MRIRRNGLGLLAESTAHGPYFGLGFRGSFRMGKAVVDYNGEHHVFSIGWFYVTWGEA